ncbi:3061_t:CDS:2 [Cetraspora pellucida]|uniref:3061_t:CDS:1 n=1 Tax=Cetraspora pellucida TaxID=1433469 RepID=A0ACA9KSH3_9GLOM|nr:3061_t:CDS:2 [Cetraspora pellucida]
MPSEEICEIVPFQKETNKINVCGYLMVKEWILINNLHHFQKFNDYNHAPQASSTKVARSITYIRDQAQGTRDPRADMPLQFQKLDDINISNSLCLTLSGEDFLVRDFIIEEERILLFTTKTNIQHLSDSLY